MHVVQTNHSLSSTIYNIQHYCYHHLSFYFSDPIHHSLNEQAGLQLTNKTSFFSYKFVALAYTTHYTNTHILDYYFVAYELYVIIHAIVIIKYLTRIDEQSVSEEDTLASHNNLDSVPYIVNRQLLPMV